jgi:hypothetical protein
MSKLFAVITTIQAPTPAVHQLSRKLHDIAGVLVVAGDRKGPMEYQLPHDEASSLHFLSLQTQLESGFSLSSVLPTGHYCRKNIGYLHAVAQGATCIYETDDDNAPLPSWQPREEFTADAVTVSQDPEHHGRGPAWVNVYRYFSREHIWPRGLPLDAIRDDVPPLAAGKGDPTAPQQWSPVQQGLVNGSPDVDAVWRLTLDRPFEFDHAPSVFLPRGYWCPFNTQSTWWWPAAYPLLYVPSFCSFRMCDIWKSFVAQRCLWEMDAGVTFHAPEVVQDRNPHDLMRDFTDELPGYQRNRELIRILADLPLGRGTDADVIAANLRACYTALSSHGFFPDKELVLVDAWLTDLKAIRG